MHSDLIRQLLEALATGWFFFALSALSAAWLLYRGAKPVTSLVVALSVPGTIGAVLVPIGLMADRLLYFVPALSARTSLLLAITPLLLFPSFVVSPGVLYFAVRRYVSQRPDYPVGYGIPIFALLIIGAAQSHIVATTRDGVDPVP
ncbi:MAG TPA: hypothetical protein VFY92_04275 [Hyphomicrobiaceae bacterium]|nr:hypothetical protein [Hyphomicrobiaceae bacterium]